ncbi:MAG: hypothetical protein LCH73_02775 [Proteobacteria bacterium]|nr:hypothetical protein [Pseudomonadota bacterium]
MSSLIANGRVTVKTPNGGRAGHGNPATYVLTDLGRQVVCGAATAKKQTIAGKKHAPRDPLVGPQRSGESDAAYEDRLFSPVSPPVGPNLQLNSIFSAASGIPQGVDLRDPQPQPQAAPNPQPPAAPGGLYWTPAYPLPAYRPEPAAPPAQAQAQAPDAATNATHLAAAGAISWPAASAHFDTMLQQLGATPPAAPASPPPALEVAVWMDGSLLIVRGGRQLHLSAAHTQQLRRFLAQTHPIS